MLRTNNAYVAPDTTPAGLHPASVSSVTMIQKVMVATTKNNEIDSKKDDALALVPASKEKAQSATDPIPAVKVEPERLFTLTAVAENILLEKVDFSYFREQFNRHGDLIYGFRKPRDHYINAVVDKKITLSSAMITANAINIWMVPEDRSHQGILPFSLEKYHVYLRYHPVSKYRKIAERNIWTKEFSDKCQIWSCKALIAYTAYSGHKIHFVLDDRKQPWDMAAVARKDPVVDVYVTAKELRFIYKHYATLKEHILFWKRGQQVAAPWETTPDDWKLFRRKRDATAAQPVTNVTPSSATASNWVSDYKPPTASPTAGCSCVVL